MWFNLNFVPPESFLETASWIFRSEVVLEGVSVEQFWDYILTNDDALQQWHPECSKIEWKVQQIENEEDSNEDKPENRHRTTTTTGGGRGAERVVTYKDWPFMILLLGPIQIYEHFDIWEDGGSSVNSISSSSSSNVNAATNVPRRYGFYFKAFTRPSFLTYTGGREEFKIEPVYVDDGGDSGGGEGGRSGTGSSVKFTRIVALEPAFIVRWILGFIAYPRMKYVFETKCPKRLVEAFQSNKFNIPKPTSTTK